MHVQVTKLTKHTPQSNWVFSVSLILFSSFMQFAVEYGCMYFLLYVIGSLCSIQVKNPSEKVILSRHYAAEGRFTFTSHESGEHTICIGTNSTRWFGGNRLVNQYILTYISTEVMNEDVYCMTPACIQYVITPDHLL